MLNELNLTIPQMLVVMVLLIAALVVMVKVEHMNQLADEHIKQAESLQESLKLLDEEVQAFNRDMAVVSRYGSVMQIEHH